MKVKDRLASLIYSFFAVDKKEHPAPPIAQDVLTPSDETPPEAKSDGENK
jgi:hypothetical protein